jgi:putative secretion ATPase (PEP-CTERM system associated)
MYETYYKLSGRPFQLNPDPRFFFSSRGHGRALAYLVYGVHQGEGFIVITGEIGAGKTMLARALVRNIKSEKLLLASVVSTSLEPGDVLRMVACEFGLRPEENKALLIKQIEEFLLAGQRQGKRALLLVDEAQNLPVGSLEELRMISNFGHADMPLLQTFLLGQPEFHLTLRSRELAQFRQRIIASCHLGPLDAGETKAYILHRLQTVGWRGDPSFSSDAYEAIHSHTNGIPRKINLLCDRLMLMGSLDAKHDFTATEVNQVIGELREEFAFAELAPDQEGIR